eukprot:2794103-Rhodomonas_salina.1
MGTGTNPRLVLNVVLRIVQAVVLRTRYAMSGIGIACPPCTGYCPTHSRRAEKGCTGTEKGYAGTERAMLVPKRAMMVLKRAMLLPDTMAYSASALSFMLENLVSPRGEIKALKPH